MVLLFPDGRLGSSRWTSLAWAAGVIVLVASVSAALAADGTGSPAPVNPAAVTGLPQLPNLAEAATGACTLVLAPLCLVGLLVRHRRSSAERRQQLRWFVAGAVVAVAAPLAGIFLPLRLHQALALVGVAGLIGGIVVGAARYRLYEIDGREIDLLLGRAAVYGALALAAGVVYWVMHVLAVRLGVRAGLGPSAVALVAVVVAWRPLRAQATDAVERLRSPRRAYQALRSLGHCLESSMVPDHVLPALAGTIAAALELPYVAVEVGSDEEVTAAAVYGEPQEEVIACRSSTTTRWSAASPSPPGQGKGYSRRTCASCATSPARPGLRPTACVSPPTCVAPGSDWSPLGRRTGGTYAGSCTIVWARWTASSWRSGPRPTHWGGATRRAPTQCWPASRASSVPRSPTSGPSSTSSDPEALTSSALSAPSNGRPPSWPSRRGR